jgi:ABC-2 type transport system ATP-binding protein
MKPAVIEVKDLVVSYGERDAVKGLSLAVQPGTCHALFGRNGAGKTSTMRALLGLLRPQSGSVSMFGLDVTKHEAEVKEKLAWVPDAPGFHPWMTVRETLDYTASLRTKWDRELEAQLLERFELDLEAPTSALSKGQKTQLALACALSADPEVLVLDEPTSGLDPLVRRQFLEAVIGVFQERAPTRKTILVSTHLISEFEGVVDAFTVMSAGKAVLSTSADDARARFCRVRAWFEGDAPTAVPMKTVKPMRREGRMLELFLDGSLDEGRGWLTAQGASRVDEASLSLEDIFLLAA